MSDLADQMKADALEAQRFSRKHLVLELDFSEASIDELEANVDTVEYAIEGGKSEGNVQMLSRIWGAYLGESLRKQCGGEWGEQGGSLALANEQGSVSPQEHVRQRLLGGTSHHLGDYFRQAVQQLSG